MDAFLDVDWSKLTKPLDDGAAGHLKRARLPDISLPATDGGMVDIANLVGITVLYVYPRTGGPGIPLPKGWDLIPGARGCMPQSCGFRDHFAELRQLRIDHLFGLSAQTTSCQREAADRLHLPFSLLSDHGLRLAKMMNLPMFTASGMVLLKRLTLIIQNGRVDHVFYPVFPPDRHALEIVAWLEANQT